MTTRDQLLAAHHHLEQQLLDRMVDSLETRIRDHPVRARCVMCRGPFVKRDVAVCGECAAALPPRVRKAVKEAGFTLPPKPRRGKWQRLLGVSAPVKTAFEETK